MVSHLGLGSDPPIGSDRELGRDRYDIQTPRVHFITCMTCALAERG